MRTSAPSSTLTSLLRGPGPLVVLTGAGISAESGLETFRGPGGIWEGRDPLDLATSEAFLADPLTVWRFFAWRRAQAASARPNAAHRALAALEVVKHEMLLVTQNVDGLHERSGSRRLVRLHGSLWRLRCVEEGTEWDESRVDLGELPPRCACGGLLRPAVVWFGENLPEASLAEAQAASRRARVMLVVGTSCLVYPAAELPRIARNAGAYVVEVNPEETPLSALANERLAGPAGEILPLIAEAAGVGVEDPV